MNKSKQIFLLYSCDEWKSWGSMRLIGTFLNPKECRMAIKTLIDQGQVEFGQDIERFNDYSLKQLETMELLKYVYISEHYDGEFFNGERL